MQDLPCLCADSNDVEFNMRSWLTQKLTVVNDSSRGGPGSEDSLDQSFSFDHQQPGRLTGGDRHITEIDICDLPPLKLS